jgi:hypothetical protein
MKPITLLVALSALLMAASVQADAKHDKWVIIESMSSPLYPSSSQNNQPSMQAARPAAQAQKPSTDLHGIKIRPQQAKIKPTR